MQPGLRAVRGRVSSASHRVIDAFEEAQREGRGVVTVDGRMIENLHVDNAHGSCARGGHQRRMNRDSGTC